MHTNTLSVILLLSVTTELHAKMNWTVYRKVPGFGHTLILFCELAKCCKKTSGWAKWTSSTNFDTLILSVKETIYEEGSKYDGRLGQNGFYLMIKNISSADFGVNYSCTYGTDTSPKQILRTTDAFEVQKDVSTNLIDIHNEDSRNGQFYTIVVLCTLLSIAVIGLILFTFCLCKDKLERKFSLTKEAVRPLVNTKKNSDIHHNKNNAVDLTDNNTTIKVGYSDVSLQTDESSPQTMVEISTQVTPTLHRASLTRSRQSEYDSQDEHPKLQKHKGDRVEGRIGHDKFQTIPKQIDQRGAHSICTPGGYALRTTNTKNLEHKDFHSLPPKIITSNQSNGICGNTVVHTMALRGDAGSQPDLLDSKDRLNTETSSMKGYMKSHIDSLKSNKKESSFDENLRSLTMGDSDDSEFDSLL